MLSLFWKLFSSDIGKALLPIIKEIIRLWAVLKTLFYVYQHAFKAADAYKPSAALLNALQKEGFFNQNNIKTMVARKYVYAGLENKGINIKDIYINISIELFYEIVKHKRF